MRNRFYHANSLVEIILVIALIAILAFLLIPNEMQTRQNNQLDTCKQNLLQLGVAIQMYRIRHKTSDSHERKPKSQRITPENTLVKQGYLKTVPKCPTCHEYYSWQTNYAGESGLPVDIVYHNSINVHANLNITGTFPQYHSKYGGVIVKGKIESGGL